MAPVVAPLLAMDTKYGGHTAAWQPFTAKRSLLDGGTGLIGLASDLVINMPYQHIPYAHITITY